MTIRKFYTFQIHDNNIEFTVKTIKIKTYLET